MSSSVADTSFDDFEAHRSSLVGYCYRMLGSSVDAQDAAQETLIKAWKAQDDFEGRSQLRTWLYRIATNVCLDMVKSKEARIRPVDLGPASEPVPSSLHERPEVTWLEPMPDADLSDALVGRETIRLAFVAALQQLPPKQRAALILCEVFKWSANEAAELLDMSTASVNSALQRARSTIDTDYDVTTELDPEQKLLLERYVEAFEAYDIAALSAVIKDDARMSMPPYDLWLDGRDDVFTWWFGPGIGCKGSRVIPVGTVNGLPAFGQYKPSPDGGYTPWALQVIELEGNAIGEMTFFLDTDRMFPLFGLPDHLDAGA